MAEKTQKCQRQFETSGGELVGRATNDTVAVVFKFANDHTFRMPLSELPDGVKTAALAFGVNTSVGNTIGAISDLEEMIDAVEARWEVLKGGNWSSERQTGPRISDLLQAVVEVFTESGKSVDEPTIAKMRANIEGEVEGWTSKALLAKPTVRAKYDAIKAQRALERSQASLAKAKETADDALPTI